MLGYFSSAETQPPEQRRRRQLRRVQQLLEAVAASNPFYQRKLQGARISSWGEFHQLPLTGKQELVEDQEANPLFGTNLTYPLDRYVRLHQTSGTTGRPLRWLDTEESWEWWARCWATVYTAATVGPADIILFAFSFGPFIGFWSAWEGSRLIGALGVSGSAQSTRQRLRSLLELGASVVCCTPSYALHMAQVAREEGLDLAASRVRALIVAGEPGGSIPSTRARIQEAWGATVYDHTGATEVGGHGFQCQVLEGVHMNEDEFVVEVLDPRTLRPAEEGELVITNLGRLGSPVIRYRTGDHVRLERQPCPCGRTTVRLDGGVIGRVDDMLTVRGVNVFPSAVESIVRDFSEVEEFAVEVCRRSALDELEVKVEINGGEAELLLERLRERFRERLGLRTRLTLAAPGSLPRFEMKARRVRDLRDLPPGGRPGRSGPEGGQRSTEA